MKNTLGGIALLTLILSISACQQLTCSLNKKGFINNFNTFLEQVEKADLQSDDKKWEAYDKKFETFVNECYQQFEEEMTDTEKQEFWLGSVRFYWERHGLGFVRRLKDKNDPLASEISENVREVWGGLDKVMNQLLDEFGDSMKDFDSREFENLMEDMGRDVENWGKKLEKIFNK